VRLFRREWIFPALALAFVSASARASRDDLSAQAAAEMHCNSITVSRVSDTQFLATGCGRDRGYTCRADGDCVADPGDAVSVAPNLGDADDDEAADAVASALTDMACACASAGLAHGSRSSPSSSHRAPRTSSSHEEKHER